MDDKEIKLNCIRLAWEILHINSNVSYDKDQQPKMGAEVVLEEAEKLYIWIQKN